MTGRFIAVLLTTAQALHLERGRVATQEAKACTGVTLWFDAKCDGCNYIFYVKHNIKSNAIQIDFSTYYDRIRILDYTNDVLGTVATQFPITADAFDHWNFTMYCDADAGGGASLTRFNDQGQSVSIMNFNINDMYANWAEDYCAGNLDAFSIRKDPLSSGDMDICWEFNSGATRHRYLGKTCAYDPVQSECYSSPTPAPTPAAAEPHAAGDPHCENVKGERFDIQKRGEIDFIRLPRQASAELADFDLQAEIDGPADKCLSYVKSLIFRGKHIENVKIDATLDGPQLVRATSARALVTQKTGTMMNTQLGGMVFQKTSEDKRWSQMLVENWNLSLRIETRTWKGNPYLNFHTHGLKALGNQVGGVLGLDSHVVEEQNTQGECGPQRTKNKFAAETEIGGSKIRVD